MTRCWMLTFWGKPRNQHLYNHAHESTILWLPLVVLAIASVIGGKFLNVREMMEAAQLETRKYVKIDAFATAWPTHVKEESEATAAEHTIAGASDEAPRQAFEHGEHLMHTWVGWAWLVGIGLGFLLYMNGYAVADALMKFPPLAWIHTWLYRRMYFDELYMYIFVNFIMAMSWLSAMFDRYIVDGIVNLAGHTVKRASDLAGLHDQYVVDGAVNGMADLAQDIGAAVRAPQTGRIRMYVLVLMSAVTLGLAGAILVVLSRTH
jgi:NADH:ubiquinone oxidoreductase subunit 5 (subunit L)/multisubunit Na+/H+ antiporter MnhA subunit